MFFKIILIFLLGLIPPLLRAEDNLLTLEEAVAEVLAGNPDIQAANYRSVAAKARIPQAKALDDPMVGVMFEDVPFGDNVTQGEEINYRIQQDFPFPGKRHVRGKAARFDSVAISEESRGRIRDVLLDLKRTYYEIYRIERQLGVNRENQRLLRQLLGSAETAYAAGQSTATSPLQAQVELSKLKNEEILLDQERITHMAHLKAILNRPNHEEIRISSKINWPKLTASLEEVRTMALETRPELKSLEAMQKRDKAKVTEAKQSLIPDFSLGFEYNQRPNREDAWTGTAMINLPIFFWGKNRGMINEAKASLKATESEAQSMKVHTQHEIDQAYSAVKAASMLLRSYQGGILPQARTNLEAARVAYASKKENFLTLIDAARTYKEMQMSFYVNQARLGISFAELERLVGRDLEE
jgi:outer membrane protein TolC